MKTIKRLLVMLAACLILSGCNGNEQAGEKGRTEASEGKEKVKKTEKNENKDKGTNKEQNNESKEEPLVEPLPSTYQELASRPIGEQSEIVINHNEEDYKKALKIFKDLPDVSGSPSTAELDHFYNEVLKMVQADYKGPEEAIRQLQFQSIGDPEAKDSRYQFKENLNVEIILDASGSMKEAEGGRVRMDAAKASILEFVQKLPKEAKVALRVYGHKGSGSDTDQKLSCSSSEIMYPLSSYDQGKFQETLNKITPAGWTPTGLALTEAKKDLQKYDGKTNTNIVYLVSDGVSTCEDNPVEAAKSLFDSTISPIINVIGFDVDSKGQNELKKIAESTKGLYSNVADENELSKELSKLGEIAADWEDWKRMGNQALEGKHIQNNLDIFVYITDEEYKSTFEQLRADSVFHLFWTKKKLSMDSYNYLEKKNKEYHDWIDGEIAGFKTELKTLNEKGYADALKTLEDKYQQNSN